jgi:hypothetical protein
MLLTLPTARDAFAHQHQARAIKWSGYNLGRLLRLTGERPERVAEMREILDALGMGPMRHWPSTGGVFDHGEMWGRSGKPWCVVGHPYGVDDEERERLAILGRRFPTLRVGLNDHPSYYGHGTDHVRIEVIEPRRPFAKPPSTRKTRSAARDARKAFAEELGALTLDRDVRVYT